MKFAKTILAVAAIATAVFSTTALASSDKIKLYTSVKFAGSVPIPINFPVDVSIVIDGQLMVLKNHQGGWDYTPDTYDSYIEVDRSLNSKEITQAKFTFGHHGIKTECVARDLPSYVQEGLYGVGTSITFSCH